MRNRNVNGRKFSEQTIQAVWEKGRIIRDKNPDVWRKDACGALIRRSQYGELTSTGWEIDHKNPRSNQGTDVLRNLQPLQWENNRHKGDDYPNWNCLIKS